MATEDLSEEEAYLWTIFNDPSGIDLAEFTWTNWESEDLCWRAWPFQWSWWNCLDPLQIDQCSRSCGKSMSVMARAFSFPFRFPGNEMVITAPEGIHVDAITDKIETQFRNTKLGIAMLRGGRQGFKHKPFQATFINGARILGRIPHRDGSGIKGTHPIQLELDEAQDYPPAGWVEITETLKRGHAGATWRAHGVTRGVRDYFFKHTSGRTGWTVHRYAAMWRPTWTDEERQEKIEQYGGRTDPDYRRNVLGEHGDEVSPLFVLHRLMRCVDDNYESSFNTEEYLFQMINDAYLKEREIDNIVDALELPLLHTAKYDTFWCGMDVGYTNHPSEILVFAEYTPKADELRSQKGKAVPMDGMSRLKLVARIQLKGISAPDQFEVLKFIIRHYKPMAYAMDRTGNGLPLFQFLEEEDDQAIAEVMRGYNFSEKLLVDFDQTIEVDDNRPISKEDLARETGIKRNAPDYATDILRLLVDTKRLWLPWDKDLITEFEGQTYKVTKTTMDQYGRREYSQGKFHALDAARMAALAWKQHSIEEFMKKDEQETVPIFFVDM